MRINRQNQKKRTKIKHKLNISNMIKHDDQNAECQKDHAGFITIKNK
jgi:hypothetical protein